MVFETGQRVLAKGQPGTVAYQRMAPPDYVHALTVSVVLDSKRSQPGYRGTVFLAVDVAPIG